MEVLIASSIIFTAVSTLLPIALILEAEQKVLSDRRTVAYMLHDELQNFIWDPTKQVPSHFNRTVNNIETSLEFKQEQELIKGCVTWDNARNRHEKLCFYGLPAA